MMIISVVEIQKLIWEKLKIQLFRRAILNVSDTNYIPIDDIKKKNKCI